jgi:hypothetical protein
MIKHDFSGTALLHHYKATENRRIHRSYTCKKYEPMAENEDVRKTRKRRTHKNIASPYSAM